MFLRMRVWFGFVACLLTGTAGQGQSTASAGDGQMTANSHELVLILHGLCAEKSTPHRGKSCETVITREHFDTLIAALDSHMPESNRLVLATEYTKLLVLANEAERLKLDRDPAFKELLDFTRLQLLERQLVRKLEEEASSISLAEVVQYYREHSASFEEGSFAKLEIPKQGKWSPPEQAEAIQQRATAGEDFVKLQQEVWTTQGRPSGAPATQTGVIRRSNLPEALQKIFELKPGDVSSLISHANSYYIYKMESRRVIPQESAASEIRALMANQRFQDRISKLHNAVMVSVNQDYFGTLPSTEELARHHGMEHQGSHLMPMSSTEKESKTKP